MVYFGNYDLTIDEKNRLSIPASIRNHLDPERDGSGFYLVPGSPKTTLSLYADRYFERYAEQHHASLAMGPDRERFEQIFYAMATRLELDKQGRVVLPQAVLRKVGIGREVTLTGARDHLILWNREEYLRSIDQCWDQYPTFLQQAQEVTEKKRVVVPVMMEPGRMTGGAG